MAIQETALPKISERALPSTKKRYRSPTGRPLTRSRFRLLAVCSFLVILAVWAIVTMGGMVKPIILPSPMAVLRSLEEQIKNGELWADARVSTYRVMVGFLFSVVIAIPVGVLAGASHRVEALVEPVVDFIRYLPIVAFVPLTIIWVGTNDAQKFLIIWLGTVFQQILMIAASTRTVPVDFVNLGATLGLGRVAILFKIVLPSVMPRIWDTLRITLGWAWTWLMIAELVAATTGMGYRITQAQRFLATDLIIGYVIVLGIIGLVFDQAMRAIGHRLFAYERITR